MSLIRGDALAIPLADDEAAVVRFARECAEDDHTALQPFMVAKLVAIIDRLTATRPYATRRPAASKFRDVLDAEYAQDRQGER